MEKENYKLLIALVIVCGLVMWGNIAEDRVLNSTIRIEQNDRYIVSLEKKNQNATDSLKFNDYKLFTYDKKSKEQKKISIENYESLFPIEEGGIRVGEKWVLQCCFGSNIIYGINIENGDVEELVNKERNNSSVNAIKDFEIDGNKIIYSYVNNGKSYVEIKDISSNEVTSLGEYSTIETVLVSIYGDKAAYIVDNNLYLYDINNNSISTISNKLYGGDIVIYKDNIYTNKIERGDEYERYSVVKIDYNFDENVIIDNFLYEVGFNIADQYVEFDKFFYDMSSNKLFVKIGSYQSTYSSTIVQGYFYESGEKIKALKENENYTEYPFKSGEVVLRDLFIDDKKEAEMLSSGEILILSNDDKEDNKMIKYYEGFNKISPNNKYQYIYKYPCIYGIEIDNGKYELAYFNIETGKKHKIDSIQLNENEEITCSFQFKDKVAFLIQGESNSAMYLYDVNSNKLKKVLLEIDERINTFMFNDKAVIALTKENRIFMCGIKSGYILNEYRGNNGDLYINSITDEGIIVDDESGYYMLDFNFNKIKTFDNYDEMMSYYEKNK